MLAGIGIAHLHVRADNQQIADAGAAGRRAVDGNNARAAFGGDGVGRKTLTVINVINIDSFIFQNAGGIQKILVDGAGAFIMQVCLGDFYLCKK